MSPEAELAKDRRSRKPPEMHHRHFAYIAATIATLDPEIRRQVAGKFAIRLRHTNANFDSNRFMIASGVEYIESDKAAAEYEEIVSLQK